MKLAKLATMKTGVWSESFSHACKCKFQSISCDSPWTSQLHLRHLKKKVPLDYNFVVFIYPFFLFSCDKSRVIKIATKRDIEVYFILWNEHLMCLICWTFYLWFDDFFLLYIFSFIFPLWRDLLKTYVS